MSRSAPKSIFGVHGVTPYSRTTGLPYGELRIAKNSSLSMQGDLIDQFGGSSKYPWASEEGAITAELSLNIGELPNFIYELFLGVAPTAASAQSSGSISTITDKNGTSIVDATNGIASVFLLSGSSANLKLGKYVVKAVGTDTFNVYLNSSIDQGRGTDTTFLTDDMCVASAVAFTASVASVPALGLSFAQIGTLAFTTSDTATFEVLPVNSSSDSVRIGGTVATSFPEYGALVYGQKRGGTTGQMIEFDCFRCKSAGMPIPFEMGAWAGFELKAKLLHDETKDGIFDMRFVSPT